MPTRSSDSTQQLTMCAIHMFFIVLYLLCWYASFRDNDSQNRLETAIKILSIHYLEMFELLKFKLQTA